jgi:hypothetical protein
LLVNVGVDTRLSVDLSKDENVRQERCFSPVRSDDGLHERIYINPSIVSPLSLSTCFIAISLKLRALNIIMGVAAASKC